MIMKLSVLLKKINDYEIDLVHESKNVCDLLLKGLKNYFVIIKYTLKFKWWILEPYDCLENDHTSL